MGLALCAVAGGISLLHWVSPHVPGAAGRTYSNNLSLKSDPRALFYTEVGDVSEFLDTRHGRYGQVGRETDFPDASPDDESARPLLPSPPDR